MRCRLESRTLLADGPPRTDSVQDYPDGPDGRTMALFDWQVEVECAPKWYGPGAGHRLVVVEVSAR